MRDEFKPLPSQDLLLIFFRYDQETGKLYRVFKGGRLKETGGLTESGHLEVRFNTERYYAHRIIWKIMHGYDPGHIDHRDGNGSNNRPGNMREADKSKNGMNRRAPKTNRSGFKGVSWHKRAGKWTAQITSEGRTYYLGLHSRIEDAVAAHKVAAENLHRDFANTKGPANGA